MFAEALIATLVGLLAAALLTVLYAVIRAVSLVVRGGGFQLWLACPNCQAWARGIAFYGQKRLAWYKLFGFKLLPNRVFARADMDVVQLSSPDITSGLTTVTVRELGGDYKMAMEPAHASAFVSWATSSPPEGDISLQERIAEYEGGAEKGQAGPADPEETNGGGPEA